MIREVDLFRKYAQVFGRGRAFATCLDACLDAMERGFLHVDATNREGHTFGVVYLLDVEHGNSFHPSLWQRYWALGPDVVTFWSAIPIPGMCSLHVQDILMDTPALWADIAIVPLKHAWLAYEVGRRIRASLRFVWIAAVAVLQ
jgi:hypothetical protein